MDVPTLRTAIMELDCKDQPGRMNGDNIVRQGTPENPNILIPRRNPEFVRFTSGDTQMNGVEKLESKTSKRHRRRRKEQFRETQKTSMHLFPSVYTPQTKYLVSHISPFKL